MIANTDISGVYSVNPQHVAISTQNGKQLESVAQSGSIPFDTRDNCFTLGDNQALDFPHQSYWDWGTGDLRFLFFPV